MSSPLRSLVAPLALVSISLLAGTGCCKRRLSLPGGASKSPATTGSLATGRWSNMSSRSEANYDSDGCQLIFNISSLSSSGELRARFCKGVEVSVAGESWVEHDSIGTPHALTITSKLGALRPGKEGDLLVPLTITLARETEAPVVLPHPTVFLFAPDARAVAARLFQNTPLPIAFDGEAPAPPKARTAFIVWDGSLSEMVGAGATLAEVDYVAKTVVRRRGEKSCAGYKSDSGKGPLVALSFRVEDYEAKLIDRRTGALVATRVFPAVETCPTVVKGRTDTMRPEMATVTAWVAKQLAGGTDAGGGAGAPAVAKRKK